MNVCPQCNAKFAKNVRICPKDGTILVGSIQPSDTLTGKIVDNKYKVIRKVGTGGMGTVYKAEHTLMKRVVAIKVLHRQLLQNHKSSQFLMRFQREARMASRIEHPNAVTIYDFGMHSDRPYLVMQYIEGRSLKMILKQTPVIDNERVFKIMDQVCAAVCASHKLGIIHRDLKPDNIMVTLEDDASEMVRVLDFGIAKVVSDEEMATTTITDAGVVMGTPQYISPEQVLGKGADKRSDIYSLGAILYQMVTGTAPHDGGTGVELMLKHVNDPLVPPRKRTKKCQIPENMEKVILKALARDPENRFQSVAELRSALKEIFEAERLRQAIEAELEDETELVEIPRESGGWIKSAVAACGIGFLSLSVGFLLYPAVMIPTAEESRMAQSVEHIESASRLISQGQFTAAFHDLQAGLELDSDNALGHFYMGKIQVELNRFDEARVSLEKAVELDDSFSAAHYQLGDLYLKMGQRKDAVKEFRATLKIEPKHERARSSLELLAPKRSRSRRKRR